MVDIAAMDPTVVLIITWVTAGLVVAAYVWFVVWRYRVDRRKKAAEAASDEQMRGAISRLAPKAPAPSAATPVAATQPVSPPASAVAPDVAPRTDVDGPRPVAAGEAGTVAGALAGVQLPNDLAPLTTMAPRLGSGDRVAFWTDTAPFETVGPAFSGELERLGYDVQTLETGSLAAQRDDVRLLVVVHPDGRTARISDEPAFPSVPENSVVVEVWLPE